MNERKKSLCGKTVTLTAIANQLKDEKEWIVINIRSNADITNELVAYLYANVPFMTKYIDANLNLSAFGIGVSLSKEQAPVSSLSVILGRLMKEVKAKKKKILVVIDEARKTDALIDFIQEFQILIREEYPIYLLVAGLYDEIWRELRPQDRWFLEFIAQKETMSATELLEMIQ